MFLEILFGGCPSGAENQKHKAAGGVTTCRNEAGQLEVVFGGKDEVRYRYDQLSGLWSRENERVGYAWFEVSRSEPGR